MTVYFQENFSASGSIVGAYPAVNLNPTATSWVLASGNSIVSDGAGLGRSSGNPPGFANDPAAVHIGTNSYDWGGASPPSSMYGTVTASFTLLTTDGLLEGSTTDLCGIKLHLNGSPIEAGIKKLYGSHWLIMTGSAGVNIDALLSPSTTYHLEATFATGASSVAITELSVTANSSTTFPTSVGLSNVTACLDRRWKMGPLTISSATEDPTVRAICSAASVLAAPALLADFTAYQPPAAIIAARSVLGAPRLALQHDFTALLGDVISVYVVDLITDTETLRVPVSSWQATLRAGASSYVQCVIPACEVWASVINAATEFVVSRRALLPSGQAVEAEMARAPADNVQFDQGPQRYTCTLSGYAAGYEETTDPSAGYDRTLTGIRSITSGNQMRVRCAVDWLLRPGQRAFANGEPFVVEYINFYAPGSDAYMDVGA